MNRPSYWILLLTTFACVAYAVLPRSEKAAAVGPTGESAAGGIAPKASAPVVVRRTVAQKPPIRAADALLQGRILDCLGWPLPNATVGLVDGDRHTTTDERGVFGFLAPAFRQHRVRVAAPGCDPRTVLMHPRADAVVALDLSLPWAPADAASVAPPREVRSLAGEGFLRAEDGSAIAFGQVTVRETGDRVFADYTGRYRVALPDSAVTLLAHDLQGRVAQSEPVYGVRKQGLVPLPVLTLQSGLVLRGNLRDPAGDPCVGASLRVRGQGVRRLEVTGAGGAFAFAGLVRDTYVVEALPHRGALGFERQISLDAGADLELHLVEARALRVQVFEQSDAGDTGSAVALAGVHVLAEEGTLRRAYGLTGDDGYATLEGLGPGPFAFEVRKTKTHDGYAIVGFEEPLGRLTVVAP